MVIKDKNIRITLAEAYDQLLILLSWVQSAILIEFFYFNEYFQNQLDYTKDKKLLINQMNGLNLI